VKAEIAVCGTMLRRKPLPVICWAVLRYGSRPDPAIDHEGKGGHDLEINQSFDRYPPDLLRLPYGGNAMDYGAEND
jgi:hypothetical protein